MKKALLLSFGLFITSILSGQSSNQRLVFGAVIDNQGFPVSYALIAVYSGNSIRYGTSTDSSGLFELLMNEEDELEISHLSFDNTRRTFDELMEYPIVEMKATKHSLETVVVVAEWTNRLYGGTGPCGSDYSRRDTPDTLQLAFNVNEHDQNWQVYPNPTSDEIRIKPPVQDGFISLFSSIGIPLRRIRITDDMTTLHLGDLPDGLYFLRYENRGWRQWVGQVAKVGSE